MARVIQKNLSICWYIFKIVYLSVKNDRTNWKRKNIYDRSSLENVRSWPMTGRYFDPCMPVPCFLESAPGCSLNFVLQGEALIRGGAHLNVGDCGKALILIVRQIEKIFGREIKGTINQSKTRVMVITNRMFYNSISILSSSSEISSSLYSGAASATSSSLGTDWHIPWMGDA